MLDEPLKAKERDKRFWNRFAPRYAARPIQDGAAYEALIANASSRLRATDRVLEIGCGTGGTAIRLAPAVAQLTATDFSAEMVKIAKSKPAPGNLCLVVSEATTAIEGAPYDAICTFNVLHLVKDPPDLLKHIHAQLRPGGLFLSKTWCFADLGVPLRLLFSVLRRLGLFPPSLSLSVAQLQRSIVDAGFDIVDLRILGSRVQNPYIVARKPAGQVV